MALVPTTLQTIITAARLRADMRTSQYLTDAEFTSHINASLSQLDAILVSKFDSYKITAVLTNVTSGTNNLALPADFLKFQKLDVQFNGNTPDGYIAVKQIAFQKMSDRMYPFSSVSGGPQAVRYTLLGQNVVLTPAALAGQYTYRLWYTPDYIQLVNPTDTLQPYMDSQMWYDYAVCDVAAKVATMQGLTDEVQVLMAQSQELRDSLIRLSTPNRDAGEPKAVVDTRDDGNGYGGGGYGYGW